ncbi:MAG: FKBP-type peptidyl-prolyl cis-trans isomerase, partial [Bacteroidota bacterium]
MIAASWVLILGSLLFSSSCSDGGVEGPADAAQDSTITAELMSVGNDSASRDDNGIYTYPIVINPGGRPSSNGVLSIYYTVRVLGSSSPIDVYDRNDGDPLVMRQGANAIYPVGLDLALPVMNEGDTYGFIIPSHLAYDTLEFSTLIPANSIIEFEVELVQVRAESEVVSEEATGDAGEGGQEQALPPEGQGEVGPDGWGPLTFTGLTYLRADG